MVVIAIVILLWSVSALVRRADNKRQQKTIDRINRGARERQLEQARLREEWRTRQAEAKAEVARLAAVEREQMRLAKEQEKQAAQLAKHEERITKLEHRMELAEREIEHYRPVLKELEAKAEVIGNKVWWYEQKGLPCEGIKKELAKVNEQKYKIETKVIKAEQAKELCEKQMEVA